MNSIVQFQSSLIQKLALKSFNTKPNFRVHLSSLNQGFETRRNFLFSIFIFTWINEDLNETAINTRRTTRMWIIHATIVGKQSDKAENEWKFEFIVIFQMERKKDDEIYCEEVEPNEIEIEKVS